MNYTVGRPKFCNDCRQEKNSLVDFTPSGIGNSLCRECHKKRSHDWRRKNLGKPVTCSPMERLRNRQKWGYFKVNSQKGAIIP